VKAVLRRHLSPFRLLLQRKLNSIRNDSKAKVIESDRLVDYELVKAVTLSDDSIDTMYALKILMKDKLRPIDTSLIMKQQLPRNVIENVVFMDVLGVFSVSCKLII
jgi:hypothetical protein